MSEGTEPEVAELVPSADVMSQEQNHSEEAPVIVTRTGEEEEVVANDLALPRNSTNSVTDVAQGSVQDAGDGFDEPDEQGEGENAPRSSQTGGSMEVASSSLPAEEVVEHENKAPEVEVEPEEQSDHDDATANLDVDANSDADANVGAQTNADNDADADNYSGRRSSVKFITSSNLPTAGPGSGEMSTSFAPAAFPASSAAADASVDGLDGDASAAEPSRSILDPNFKHHVFTDDEVMFADLEIPDLPEDELSGLHHIVLEVKESKLPDRITQLRKELEDQTIMVGTLSIDDIKHEEALLEKQRIASVQAEMEAHQRRQQDLIVREQEARKRLHAERQTSVLESREEAMSIIARSFVATKDQQQAFRKAEDRLKSVLEDEKATVKSHFGDLVQDERAVKGRRYQVNWDDAPRLVCIKNMVLRAVKNKLPSGRYVMLCTLFDRLGGVPLRWSRLKDFGHFHRTRYPVRHNGRYYDVEISFKQRFNKLFLACPSKTHATPSMVFVFELFQVRNDSSNKTDRVVAWGAFPMCDPSFDVVKGYFKVPLLRGEYDPTIDRFEEMERRIATNLDSWLCNLYFTAEHWPRYLNGQREYEVELKYTQELLQLPEFDHPLGVGASRGANEGDGDESEEDAGEGGWKGIWNKQDKGAAAGLENSKDANATSVGGAGGGKTPDYALGLGGAGAGAGSKTFDELLGTPSSSLLPSNGTGSNNNNNNSSGGGATAKSALASDMGKAAQLKVGEIKIGVRTVEKARSMDIFQDLDQVQEAEAEALKAKNEAIKLEEARRQTRLLQKYRYAISDPNTSRPQNPLKEKLRYISCELKADLGLHRIATFEFWSFIILLFLMIWLRMYVHYLGEYLFLQGSDVVISGVDIRPHTVYIRYSQSTTSLATEIVTSFIGVLANQAVFLVLTILSFLFQRGTGIFPDTFSRIMLSYGLSTLADPLLILLVDVCDTYWSGDSFKLYNYYEATEMNGIPGILLTVALTLALIAVSAFILYQYLLLVHANGRMLDLHHRLHGDEGCFFIPQDFEISLRTLRWIITKTRRAGTGMLGAKNKISVTSYTVKDHLDPSFEATTIHLAIFKQPLTGEEQLFRHFVRQPDGAILEIFDNVEAAGLDEYKKLEQRLGKKHTGSLAPSFETIQSAMSTSAAVGAAGKSVSTSTSAVPMRRENISVLAARRRSMDRM